MASDFKIIDKSGDWFVNRALFRFVDPTNETNPTIFEPGLPTKVKPTEWMKGQELIVACPDPMTSDDPIPTVIVPTDNTLVPNDDVSGEPDVASASGIQATAAADVATAAAAAPAKAKK